MRRARVPVTAGIVGVLLGTAVIGVLHLVGPGARISPIRRTISEYMLTGAAWAFDVGVLAIAASSVAILVGIAQVGARRAGLLLGALWVAGLVTLVAFPKADWALGPSLSGQVHRAASMVAFLALPLAVVVLLARHAGGGPGRVAARWAIGLAVTGLAWFTPIIVAIASAANGGRWWTAVPLGLVERGMAVTEIAALVVLAAWTLRRCAVTGDPAAPAPAGQALPAAPVTDPAVP